ncbi:MAG: hypothetical protein K2G29_00375, partial [Muribaculaceae bacterium]|nr:hypothetical protein [Muribaculaceae bacterium]
QTIYNNDAGAFPAQDLGTINRKGDRLFVHVFDSSKSEIDVPVKGKVKGAKLYADGTKVKYTKNKNGGITLHLDSIPQGCADHIIELKTSI